MRVEKKITEVTEREPEPVCFVLLTLTSLRLLPFLRLSLARRVQ